MSNYPPMPDVPSDDEYPPSDKALFNRGVRAGERAVSAYLRDRARAEGVRVSTALLDYADMIEKGEHRG